jgi:hypothetical protein
MAMLRQHARPDRFAEPAPPIRYLTENGFSIIRLSEIDPSVIDTPGKCSFAVQREDEAERKVSVGFDRNLIDRIRIRNSNSLPDRSVFWLVCAESYLANYLWEQNGFPPDGWLIIDELSPDELMLALHWQDRD